MTALSKVSLMLIFLFFALPLLFSPITYLAFELPKVFLLYIFSVVIFYFLLKSGYRLGNLTKIHYLYLIFFAWIIVSAIFGLSFSQSFLGSYFRMQGILSWICYGILFFTSGKVLEEAHNRLNLSFAILVGSVVASGIALAQFISLWFLGNTSQLLYSGRVISTFGQPNFLGGYLVMSLPFTWYLLKQVNKKRKVLIGFLMVVVVLGIFSTFSRSAYLGLLILSCIWGFYHYRLLLVGITFSILLFGFLATLFPNLVYNEWYRFKIDTVSKWTAENRQIIAQKSLNLVQQNPITGYGIENFSLAFPRVVNQKDLGLKDIVVDSSHNLFLDLIVETGVVGLGLFLAAITTSIIFGLKQLKFVEKSNKDFIKAAICVVIAFLVIHQFSVISVVPMTLLWLSLAILGGPLLKHSVLQKKAQIIINFVGLTLISLTAFYIIQTIRAEGYFRKASAYEVTDINKAINLDNEAIKLAPWIEFYSIRRNFLLKQLGY